MQDQGTSMHDGILGEGHFLVCRQPYSGCILTEREREEWGEREREISGLVMPHKYTNPFMGELHSNLNLIISQMPDLQCRCIGH